MFKKKFFLLSTTTAIAAVLLATGCNPKPSHPNQINNFDGVAYDTLVLAHGALAGLREPVKTQYAELVPAFNSVAEAYADAVKAYSLYRDNPITEATTSNALRALTLSLAVLEGQLELNLKASGSSVQNGQLAAQKAQAKATGKFSISELLSGLQLAAAIAGAIPGAESESLVAQVLLQATQQAFLEWQTVKNQPIDLSALGQIELI